MLLIKNPIAQFFTLDGDPLDNGSVYIGTPGLNPETNPVALYWDRDGLIPAAQPVKTSRGYISNNGTPARIYINDLDYSVNVRDKNGVLIYSSLSATGETIGGFVAKTGDTMTGPLSVPAGASGAQVPQAQEIGELANSQMGMAGQVAFFAKSSAPTGWLKANGAAVSRTTYAALFAAIGTTFGVGDGATTFGLPDLRGEFPRGWDDSRGVDSGRAFGSAQGDGVKQARVDIIPSNNPGSLPLLADAQGDISHSNVGASSDWSVDFINIAQKRTRLVIGSATETRGRNVALLACIKY